VSSPLAIAAVTAVLKDLLNDGLINNDLAPVGSFTVSALPPDRITTGETEDNRLNLFLYQVTPNLGWRNEGLPSVGPHGGRLSNPPLALDLHYLLTAYGSTDLNAEILLGFAMELLHDIPVLSRELVRRSLSPTNPIPTNLIPADAQGRRAIDLADQIEILKITPQYLTGDELSKLWTAMQARYRTTVAYQVSTVLIQSTRPTQSALPVLQRGQKDRGPQAHASTAAPAPSWPTLLGAEILPKDGQGPRSSFELGDTIALTGALLAADTVTAEFRHRLIGNPIEIQSHPSSTAERPVFVVPSAAPAPANWPAGSYSIAVRLETAGKALRRTNEVVLSLAPRLTSKPSVAAQRRQLKLSLNFAPEIWPNQRVDVLVGGDPFQPAAVAAKTAALTLTITGATPSDIPVPVRLRVDGIDSINVRDRTAQPPQFDPQQSVQLPV
jgi:hypothetical protein